MRGGRIHVLAVALFAVACFAAYVNSLSVDFQFDDYHMIVHNNHIKRLEQLPRTLLDADITSKPIAKGMYRPVLMATFAFNYLLGGLHPAGYHIINGLIHLLNAVLLYVLMLSALPGIVPTAAIVSALLFVVHPLNTQAVTYISSRSSLLATFWCLGAVLAYVRWRRAGGSGRSAAWLLLAWGCFVAGLGSKEIAIALPAVIVLWELIIGRRIGPINWARVGAAWSGFALLSVGYLWARHALIGYVGVVHPARDTWTNILTQTTVGPFFLRLWCWPHPLTIDRFYPEVASPADPRLWLAFGIVVGLLFLAWRLRRRWPAFPFGVGWFLATFFPVAFASSLSQMTAEHHAYLPGLGWHVMLAVALSIAILRPVPDILGKRRRRRRLVLACAPVVLLFAGMTIQRNMEWRNGLTIWEAAVREAPASSRAYINLGLQYHLRDQYDEAERQLLRGVQLAEGTPYMAGGLANLGALYRETGRYEEAERALRRAIDLSTTQDRPDMLVQMGLLYQARERYDDAFTMYRDALALNAEHTMAYFHRGTLHRARGEDEPAEQDFQRAIRANPDYTLAYLMLGELYDARREWQLAADTYRRAVQLDASNPAIYCRLGTALARVGDWSAIPALERAVELDPSNAEAHYNLSVALSALEPAPLGRVQDHLDRAVRLGWMVNQDFVKRVAELRAGDN